MADGTRVGSRLGTHALWTIALSVVITLLALAPLVLPGNRPLDSLPAPLRGTAQAGEIVAEALAPTQEETPEAAHREWRRVSDRLRPKLPKLSQRMDEAETDVLAYERFPPQHWPKIGSTNPIERANAEIKRRTDVVGIFPKPAAVIRLVGALMLEQNDERAVSRRYMTLEGLAAFSDAPQVRLSAEAA